MAANPDPTSTSALAARLASVNADARIAAALALGLSGDPAAVPPLLAALGDPDVNVRYHAIEALGRLRARQAAGPITAVAETRDFFLGFAALDALGAIGEPAVAPRLTPLLRDERLGVAAAEALARILGDEAVARLAALEAPALPLRRPPAPPAPAPTAPELSASVFVLLRDLIARRSGHSFDESKRWLLADKLSALLAANGLASFLEYYYLLKGDAAADRHWLELMDRLAVPETFFWRQPEQVRTLAEVIAPRHFETPGAGPLRIWSAACCSGEEPISILIALAEAGWLARGRIELAASDASPAMIERARRGVYGERSFRNLPAELRARYFRRDGERWRVDPDLLERVEWRVANLLDPAEAGPLADAHVIFCRNVFIYFSDEAIVRATRIFAEHMPPGAHLFLGASESLTRLRTAFELEELGGAFVYRRRDSVGGGRSAGLGRRAAARP